MSTILPLEKDVHKELLHSEIKDYETQGFIDAGKVEGYTSAFEVALENFYSKIVLESDLKTHTVTVKEEEIESERKSNEDKINIYSNEIKKIQENLIPDAQQELKKAENDLAEFKVNPEKFVKQDKDKFMLRVYGFISLMLALFLYFFYSSVVYSAIFREITINKSTLFNSIFYPKAFEEAIQKGFTTFITIALAPFVFLALGISLENIKSKAKNSKYKYLPTIAFGTFVFSVDALLAYHISERIYNSKAINTYGNVQPYNFFDSLGDANFWIIIALGFLVYLIFGFIFSLYNEERKKKNMLENFENMLIEKINNLKSKIASYKNEINIHEKEIKELSLKNSELISYKKKIFFSVYEIRKIISEYAKGWIKYLASAKSSESKIENIKNQLESFINKNGLADEK
ncbi:MAG: hypothetical protein N2321_00465 [Melioribacteraceae bacterium]|nr:hypothetical protein [Melioribacteraceae bacterium]